MSFSLHQYIGQSYIAKYHNMYSVYHPCSPTWLSYLSVVSSPVCYDCCIQQMYFAAPDNTRGGNKVKHNMKVNNCTLEMWKLPYHRHSYGSHLFSQSRSNCGFLLLTDVGHFEPRIKACGHVEEILSARVTVFILEIFQDV